MAEGVRYGPARVTYSGDVVRAQGYIDQAMHLLYTTRERAEAGGLEVLRAQRRLADDSYCYCVIAGGMQAVHIVAGYTVAHVAQGGAAQGLIPDFMSGATRNGYLTGSGDAQTMQTFHPTQRSGMAFDAPFDWVAIRRFAVEPYQDFTGTLGNQSQADDAPEFSQYTLLRPTWYSGLMRRCVQALMGFGRQRVDADGNPISLYMQGLPQDVLAAIGMTLPADTGAPPPTALQAAQTPYQQQVAKDGLQIRYDWSFARTHGIATGQDGTLWLVEISQSQGVIAMPLPLYPGTDLPDFYDYITARDAPDNEHANDDDALTLLDTFGGFPSGESFPSGAAFDAWVRAGRVLPLIPSTDAAVQAFYSCSAYGSGMGWAFNLSGSEAHNTAYYYDHATGLQHGVHYVVNLSFGQRANVAPNPAAADLKTALAGSGGDVGVLAAVLWKLDRLSDSQLALTQQTLGASGAAAAVQYVDGLVLPPIARGSANLHLLGDGILYTKNVPAALPIIRFPEPLLGLLVSHRMVALTGGMSNALGEASLSDTTMHVFFADDEMKWVRFFRDPGTTHAQGESNYETCMYIGSWTATVRTGTTATPTMFYTGDFDDRAELPDSETTTVITGTRAGYSGITANDDILNPSIGNAFRSARFKRETETTSVTGGSVLSSIAVPFDDREAYYYYTQQSYDTYSHSIGYSTLTLADPWSCNYWRNFPGYAGDWRTIYLPPGGVFGGWQLVHAAQHPDGCGPVTDRTAAAPSPNYNPQPCSDDADTGPWCHVCDDIDTMAYNIPASPLPAPVFESSGAAATSRTYLVASSQLTPLLLQSGPVTTTHWGLHTPDQQDGFSEDQYAATTGNVLGTAEVLLYSSNLNGSALLKGAPAWPGIALGATAFVGVLDG